MESSYDQVPSYMTKFRATRAGTMWLGWRNWNLCRHSGQFASSVQIGPLVVYWF